MEKNKLMMIIIIILLVVLLGTIVAISYYVLGVVGNSEENPAATPPPVVDVKLEDFNTFAVGEISRNLLAEDDKNHVMKATYSLEVYKVDDAEGNFLKLLGEKIDIVRDVINSVVGNTAYADIRSVNGVDRLKEQILIKLRDKFQSNLIWDVNVSAIVYQ